MTDEQIMKALEECPKNFMCCDCKCGGICDGFEELSSYTLALIARLKTEKTVLVDENKLFEEANDQLSKSYLELTAKCIEQKRKIEEFQKRYELAVSEREANVKGFSETLKEINLRQQIALDKLREENGMLEYDLSLLKQEKKYVQDEAVETFGERLKQYIANCKANGYTIDLNDDDIDILVGEATGE